MATLTANYKDDILASSMNGKRRYNVIENSDGTISLEDVTTYTQIGSEISASDFNKIASAVNERVTESDGVFYNAVTFEESSGDDTTVLYVFINGVKRELLRVNTSGSTPLVVFGDGLYSAGIGEANISAGDVIRLITEAERIVLEASSDSSYSAYLRPYNDNKCTLGNASKRFAGLWAGKSAIQTSDAREKENVKPIGMENAVQIPFGEDEYVDIHSELFDRLNPVQFNYTGDKRISYGFIAQEVVSAMEELGIEENELDLVHHEYWVDEDTKEEKESYGMAYANIIALLVHETQKLKAKTETLEAEIREIKGL